MIDIVGFPDYRISTDGKIYSYKRFDKGKVVPVHTQNNGYLFVPLWRDGKQYNRTIHRLVASHFIPNPEKFPVVNHKDNNKRNNLISNLEWCTQQYNVRQSPRKNNKLSLEIAQTIRKEYAKGDVKQKDLANKYKVSRSQIGHIIRGFSWPNAGAISDYLVLGK